MIQGSGIPLAPHIAQTFQIRQKCQQLRVEKRIFLHCFSLDPNFRDSLEKPQASEYPHIHFSCTSKLSRRNHLSPTQLLRFGKAASLSLQRLLQG